MRFVAGLASLMFVLSTSAQAALPQDSHNHNDHGTESKICIGMGCTAEDGESLSDVMVEDQEDNGIVDYIQALVVMGSGLHNNQVQVLNEQTGEVATVSLDNSELYFMTRDGLDAETLEEIKYVAIPEDYFQSGQLRFAGKGSRGVGKLVSWSECSGAVTGRYVLSKRCSSRSRRVQSSLYAMLMKLPSMLGGRKVSLVHKGISGDANHKKKKSLHNTFRAVDVDEISVDGKTYKYKYATAGRASERSFYNNLIKKWESSVRRRCGSVVRATTINWTNRNHRKHIHLGTTYGCN